MADASLSPEDPTRPIEPRQTLSRPLAHDHALMDGNERPALAATIALLGINGVRLTLTK